VSRSISRLRLFPLDLPLLFALLLFGGLACRDRTIDCQTVRRSFGEVRPVQARLTGGFPFAACTSTAEGLIPRTRCQSPAENTSGEILEMQKAALKALAERPTAEQMQAAAILRVAATPDDEAQLLAASALLREAAESETDPGRIAAIRSDLAATHLLLAELLQSPLQVAFSLEQSLWAEERDPTLAEARFNSKLGLVLLSMEPPDSSSADPWLEELSARWPRSASFRTTPTGPCPTWIQMRQALDDWAADPGAGPAVIQECLASSPDRMLAELYELTRTQPAATAAALTGLGAIRTAADRLDLAAARQAFSRLSPESLPPPLALERTSLEATLAYQAPDRVASLALAEGLAGEAASRSYFELAARSNRLAALIHQIQGDYMKAFQRLDLALEAARLSGSPQVEAAVLSILVEQQELVGREEDAWVSIAKALGALDPAKQQVPRILCLHSAARLAMTRGLPRVALKAHELAIAAAQNQPSSVQVACLKERGELLADLGLTGLARADLAEARAIMDRAPEFAEIFAAMRSDLAFLEGRVDESPARRRTAAQEASEAFREEGYARRYVAARYSLASSQLQLGDKDDAIATLQGALADLSGLTLKADWGEATGLVQASRPVADTLIGLQLERGQNAEVASTLGAYLGLRTGQRPVGPGPASVQRLTYFVRENEILILLESPAGLHLVRSGADREEVERLRETLLLRLEHNISETSLQSLTDPLAELLVEPVEDLLAPDQSLSIVVDDVVAGIPFALLPFRGQGLMVDRFAISYSTDLRPFEPLGAPENQALVVGSAALEPGLRPLPNVAGEAQEVGRAYQLPTVLTGSRANRAEVLQALEGSPEVVHLAGHFVANPRRPMSSYFILEPAANSPAQLTLQDLLGQNRHFQFLYLSACNTGRGLPISPHGLHSLAQAFTSSQIARTVITLWPLDDRTGAQIAAALHQGIAAGSDPAVALQAAQLQLRSRPPNEWAALAVYY
jgi:hypothetical protein